MNRSSLSCIIACFAFSSQGHTKSISDPIDDFLSLPIEGRFTEASEVVRIDKVAIDLDLDGEPEIMIGHPKMWWGDNRGVYFAIYKKSGSGGYQRLTGPNEDVGIVFNDGLPRFIFVGRVDELQDTGLLVFNPPIGDGSMKEQRTETNSFISITSGHAKVAITAAWAMPALPFKKR